MPKYENEHKERTLSKPIGLTGPSTTIKGLTALPMEKEGLFLPSLRFERRADLQV